MKTAMALRIFGVGRKLIGAYATHSVNCSKYTLRNICLSSVLNGTFAFCVFLNVSSGGSRIFARGVRQLVPLECPKPLHALSPSDP